jgi:hypothetical protein
MTAPRRPGNRGWPVGGYTSGVPGTPADDSGRYLPEWYMPPPMIGGHVTGPVLISRSDRLVVAVRHVVAFPAGVEVEVEAHSRRTGPGPDDQVVIHGHLHAFAERLLAPACAPAVGDISAPSVQPLSRAVLVEQADGYAQRADAAIAGELLGGVHKQCGDAPPTERPGHGDLVNQRNAVAAESGIVGLPYDRDVTDDVGTVRGDQARAVWLRVIGQIRPRLGLAIAYPLDEEPDGRLGITLVDGPDGITRNAHSTTLAYAERHTLVPLTEHQVPRCARSR